MPCFDSTEEFSRGKILLMMAFARRTAILSLVHGLAVTTVTRVILRINISD